jgi:hypothetical protein
LSRPVAAITVDDNDEHTSGNGNGSAAAVAAVMPLINKSSVLGGNEPVSDDSMSPHVDDLVSCPLSVPHLRWKAAVHIPDTVSLRMHTVDTMIDNCSHLVLIDEKTVSRLQLRRHNLHKKISIDVALKNDSKKKIALKEWVRLKLYDTDNVWAAQSVRAVIAPGLCTDVLLGLPWLVANQIVIDHAERSCIDKTTGFDLLHPVCPPRAPIPKPKVREAYNTIMNNRRKTLDELKAVCLVLRPKLEEKLEAVRDYDVASALKLRIEQLAFKDQLLELNQRVKDKYKDVFEPIPHTEELQQMYTVKLH